MNVVKLGTFLRICIAFCVYYLEVTRFLDFLRMLQKWIMESNRGKSSARWDGNRETSTGGEADVNLVNGL